MPSYRYKAKQKSGQEVEGTLSADSYDAAVHKIQQEGLYPFSIAKEELTQKNWFTFFTQTKVRGPQKEMFTRQLANLLEGGLSLYRALDLLAHETEHRAMKKIVESLRDQIKEGALFSEACLKFPQVFPPLYSNMVRAGEAGGMLDQVLRRLADFAEKEENTRTKVKVALAYPIFLASVGLATILVLMFFVIPKLVPVFEDLGQTLPLPTLIIVQLSRLLIQGWWILALLSLTLFFVSKKWPFKFWNSLKLPLVGPLLQKRDLANFTRSLGTLLSNGVPILKSLEITQDNIHNTLFRNQIHPLIEAIKEGKKLGETLKKSPYFPATISHIISVGEETGQLEQTLIKISENYEIEIDRATKLFTALLEPLLILFMGVIIAFIVMAMLLPIFSLHMEVG